MADFHAHSALHAAAATVTVTVSAPDIVPAMVWSVAASSGDIDIDVPAGPGRTFEIAAVQSGTPPTLILWGRVMADMSPNAHIDLTLPIFAAGVAAGTVATTDGAVLPQEVTVQVTAVAPRPGAPAQLSVPIRNGQFTQPLPSGDYTASSAITVGGLPYTLASTFSVQTGAVLNVAWLFAPPPPAAASLTLAFGTLPSVTAGSPFSVDVRITDVQGHLVPQNRAAVVLSLHQTSVDEPPLPLLGLLTQTARDGVATFSGLSYDVSGAGYILVAEAPSLINNTAVSAPFSIVGGPSKTGVFAGLRVQSSTPTPTAGVPFDISITAVDGNGIPIAWTSSGVTLDTDSPGASLVSPVDVVSPQVVNGIVLTTAGTAHITATDAGTQAVGSLTVAVQSAAVANVVLGDAVPAGIEACRTFSTVAMLYDAYDNAVTASTPVELALVSSPNTSLLNGASSVASTHGIVTFSNMSIRDPGTYALVATAGGISSDISAQFYVQPALPVVSGLTVGPWVSNDTPVTYTISQACGAPANVQIQVGMQAASINNPDTSYAKASEGRAQALTMGTRGVPTSPTGLTHTFVWDSGRDVQHATRDNVTLRAVASVDGLSTTSSALPFFVVHNGLDANTFVPGSVMATSIVWDDSLTGDVNKDGTLDVVGLNRASGSVSVLLINRTGLPTGLNSFNTAAAITNATLADLNGDGAADLVVSMANQNIGIYLGHGDGTFAAVTNVAGFPTLRGMAVTDFTHDGKLDVVGLDVSGQVFYGQGSGTGTFAVPIKVSTSLTTGAALAAADMDRDGIVDVVLADSSGGLWLAINNPPGTLSFNDSLSTGTTPVALLIADVDRDGLFDVLVADGVGNDFSVLIGTGNALQSATETTVGLPQAKLFLADLDGDSLLDLVVQSVAAAPVFFAGDGFGDFAGPITLPVSTPITALALLDINHDHKVDIIAASGSKAALPLVNNLGTSNHLPLNTPRGVHVAGGALCAAVADINNDARPDVVTCNPSSITTYVGDGDGVFKPTPSFPLATTLSGVALADLDNDGFVDLAGAPAAAGPITLLRGYGTGTFGADANFVHLSAGTRPVKVAAADLNHDHAMDLVAITDDSQAMIFLGHGNGRFSLAGTLPVATGACDLTVADINADSTPDIVVAGDSAVTVYTGTGDANFVARLDVTDSSGIQSMAVTTFNPGTPSFILAHAATPGFDVLVGADGGTFNKPAVYATSAAPQNITLGNFDNSGDMSVAFVSADNSTLNLIAGDGTGAFPDYASPSEIATGVGATHLVVTDLEGDSYSDAIVPSVTSQNLTVHPYHPGTGIPTVITTALSETSSGLELADIDNDGLLDAVVALPKSNTVAVFTGSYSGMFTNSPVSHTMGYSPTQLKAGDLNGDGKLDLVVVSQVSAYAAILPGYGTGAFTQNGSVPLGASPGDIALLDFNGDGALDFVTTNAGSNTVTLAINDKSGGFSSVYNRTIGNNPNAVAVGDFNHDNKPDLLVSLAGGAVVVALGDGVSSFTTNQTLNFAQAIGDVAVGDLDGDGNLDLALIDTANGGQVQVRRGSANGTFSTTPNVFAAGLTPAHLAFGDINNDGFLDVVVTNTADTQLTALLGDGIGGIAAAVGLGAQQNPSYAALADINRDGRLDIVYTTTAGTGAINVALSSFPSF